MRPVRVTAVLTSLALPLTVTIWAVAGPLRPGWARRAGTPAYLLGSSHVAPAPAIGGSVARLTVPFSAEFSGEQSAAPPDSSGLVSITIKGPFRGGQDGMLTVVLTGQPAGGGVALTGSQVYIGPASAPQMLQGHVTRLAGSSLSVALADARGKAYTADIRLHVDPDNNRVTGALTVSA